MFTVDLSSHLLEIPNDTDTTLSQSWLAVENSVKSTASRLVKWLAIENNEKSTLNINVPYSTVKNH